MDIHDFNPSRRRFLNGMLAVGLPAHWRLIR